MSRQRLVVVLASALFVGLIEALSDTLLDPVLPFPFDAILITIAVFFVVLAVSGAAYRRIDRLGAALAARNRDLETRAASAAALHRVSVAIAALADVRQVLDAVVENARTLLAADAAVLLLNGPDGRLVHAASSGPRDAIDRAGGRSPAAAVATPAAALPERRAADAPPANADPDADAVLRFIDPALAVGRLTVPLRRGGETVGVLAVTSKRPRSFTADDLETVASLANQATIAVENARLQARLRDLAVETERERIAREMHDGLAQVLGYVSTKSQAVEELLAVDRVDDARGQLQQLTAAARSIYVDVREAILGLRSPITPELGLVGAIERYAARFAEASKLGVVVEAAPAARTLELAPECEAQVFRIVQESL
ncbi:MAG TPA: GAF domain-containing protein, partial [Candidatus Limnocylindrales bacterium]|nr:GAF domain-containing protein [Candidatus Limnocylindrales bacterium]